MIPRWTLGIKLRAICFESNAWVENMLMVVSTQHHVRSLTTSFVRRKWFFMKVDLFGALLLFNKHVFNGISHNVFDVLLGLEIFYGSNLFFALVLFLDQFMLILGTHHLYETFLIINIYRLVIFPLGDYFHVFEGLLDFVTQKWVDCALGLAYLSFGVHCFECLFGLILSLLFNQKHFKFLFQHLF